MKTEYDIELLDSLENRVLTGHVKIHDSINPFVEKIERYFPMGFSGIDWHKKGWLFYEHLTDDKDIYLIEALKFLNNIQKEFPVLLEEKVVVLGDSLTNLSYEMMFKDFIIINSYFFSLPQHTYILFLESGKCINLTFENELYFG